MKNAVRYSIPAAFIAGILVLAGCFGLPATPTVLLNISTIYGLGSDGSGLGQYIFKIDYHTGQADFATQKAITFQGSPMGSSVFGLARKPNQPASGTGAMISVVESGMANPCGGGTAFYNVNLVAGTAAKLGTAVNYTYIKDIEFSPIDGKLYGIYNDVLVRIESFGVACSPGAPGSPAVVKQLGKLTAVGAGPYGIAFDHGGECVIVSGKDHNRAVISPRPDQIVPGSGPLTVLNLKPGSLIHYAVSDLQTNSPIETAACITGTSLIISTHHFPLSGSPVGAFYHWSSSDWALKGNRTMRDYTSMAHSDIK